MVRNHPKHEFPWRLLYPLCSWAFLFTSLYIFHVTCRRSYISYLCILLRFYQLLHALIMLGGLGTYFASLCAWSYMLHLASFMGSDCLSRLLMPFCYSSGIRLVLVWYSFEIIVYICVVCLVLSFCILGLCLWRETIQNMSFRLKVVEWACLLQKKQETVLEA